MWHRDREYDGRQAEFRTQRPAPRRPQPRGRGHDRHYGRDYWWIGEQAMRERQQAAAYDERYRRFDRSHHPRFSPVGGMYHMDGGRRAGPPPPLREPHRFSEWTRWF